MQTSVRVVCHCVRNSCAYIVVCLCVVGDGSAVIEEGCALFSTLIQCVCTCVCVCVCVCVHVCVCVRGGCRKYSD